MCFAVRPARITLSEGFISSIAVRRRRRAPDRRGERTRARHQVNQVHDESDEQTAVAGVLAGNNLHEAQRRQR